MTNCGRICILDYSLLGCTLRLWTREKLCICSCGYFINSFLHEVRSSACSNSILFLLHLGRYLLLDVIEWVSCLMKRPSGGAGSLTIIFHIWFLWPGMLSAGCFFLVSISSLTSFQKSSPPSAARIAFLRDSELSHCYELSCVFPKNSILKS